MVLASWAFEEKFTLCRWSCVKLRIDIFDYECSGTVHGSSVVRILQFEHHRFRIVLVVLFLHRHPPFHRLGNFSPSVGRFLLFPLFLLPLQPLLLFLLLLLPLLLLLLLPLLLFLSGIYLPGRPMMGGGVKSDLPFSPEFRNFSHKFQNSSKYFDVTLS